MPVFDQGYQHWSGTLGRPVWRWVPIARQGVRAGLRNRVIQAYLLLSWMPAAGLVCVVCVWGLLERKSEVVKSLMPMLSFLNVKVLANPAEYRVGIWTIAYHYFLLSELWLSMLLILLVGPSLISQDLRFNALPLYFSRPLRRIDYFLGKLGIIGAFLGLVIVVPAVAAYGLGLLFSSDWSVARQTFGILVSSVAYGMVVTVSAGVLVLALSSLSRNSRYVVLFWVGIWFVGGVLAPLLQDVARDQRRHAYFNRPAPGRRPDWSTMTPVERMRAQREMNQWANRARAEFELEELRSAKTDWRPTVSYAANLSRIGQQLLGTNAKWETFAEMLPADQRGRFMYDFAGPQYPWQWSAMVLVGLFGLSVWILNARVKSLDRLK
jgi:ABC-2 type transport system permease protein